jgi:hypothetical protein
MCESAYAGGHKEIDRFCGILGESDGEALRNWGDQREKKRPGPMQWAGPLCVGRGTYFGIRTVSITWMTPLEQMMSALVTVASLILTVPPSVLIASDWPLTVFAELSFMA